MKSEILHLRIEPEIKKKLAEVADKSGLNISSVLLYWARKGLERWDKEGRL